MKTAYKFLLALLGVSILASCEEQSKTLANANERYTKSIADELSHPGGENRSMYYFQDPRTGLCYSVMIYDRSASHANVPCTDKVMELIKPPTTTDHCK